jgi:hypothetical protein
MLLTPEQLADLVRLHLAHALAVFDCQPREKPHLPHRPAVRKAHGIKPEVLPGHDKRHG